MTRSRSELSKKEGEKNFFFKFICQLIPRCVQQFDHFDQTHKKDTMGLHKSAKFILKSIKFMHL